ncbi:hypoxia-inducible factor 1-alpha-like isoform X2 [Ornithodoros turicata]|uniref:hypoxia-inducible factor 1-alpha-like isoform X2 n=1 Tax=Ornithodoros turicata TaxID=34597 RepID=UPI00313913D3
MTVRNSEKRKEKSRDAARCRRSKESEIFTELSQQLPLPESVATQLDKASVMRLALSYLRMQELLEPLSELTENVVPSAHDSFMLDALDGFLLVLSTEGEVLFLSENVGRYLGLNQVDLIGQSLYEFCHPCDHDEVKGALEPETPGPGPCSFFVRMRSALGSKGRGVSVKSATTYKVMHCIGHAILRNVTVSSSHLLEEDDVEEAERPQQEKRSCRYLVCVARPIPHPANIEVPLDSRTFLSRHNPSMRFTHVDERIEEFLGYPTEELLGKSVYSYFDARDVPTLQKDFKTLFSKGQCETGQYRFLAKHGGCVWVLTQATLIYENSNSTKPQCVVCVNYVLSGCINKNDILAEEQVVTPRPKAARPPSTVEDQVAAPAAVPAVLSVSTALQQQEPKPCAPVASCEVYCPPVSSSTTKIFAPRTADMNKGFLMFADDDSGITVLKEECEPEDLTHLAPQAGDDSIPLEDLPSDVLDDSFVLPDPYGHNKLIPDYALLPTEECPTLGGCGGRVSPMGHGDPFLSYRDDDPMSSPGSCGTSPSEGGSRSDSLLSDLPGLESPIDQFSGLDLQTDGNSQLQEEEFDMRAPYISMTGDDFPLLSPTDSVMWGPQDSPGGSSGRSSLCDSPTFVDSPPPLIQSTLPSHRSPNLKSSLAALLVAELPPPRPRDCNRNRSASASTRRSHSTTEHHIPSRSLRNQGTIQRSNARSLIEHGTIGNHHRYYSTSSLELKMQMPSPPDPPPKRGSCGGRGGVGSPKRMRVDVQAFRLHNKDSVLLNLLVNGEDASHGYLCQTLHYDKRAPPANGSSPSLLLDEAFPSLQDIAQLDAEVSGPIHQLLTGEDLLSALDQSVPALV